MTSRTESTNDLVCSPELECTAREQLFWTVLPIADVLADRLGIADWFDCLGAEKAGNAKLFARNTCTA